jgi:hypothetical protein
MARCTLRIYSALRITHLAAIEIAHNSILLNESSEPLIVERLRLMGRFVNGLVALYTVALFNMELPHAKTILDGNSDRTWFYRSLNLMKAGAHARFELAVARCLGQISDQAYEIAEALRMCFEHEDCLDVLVERAA